MSARVTSRFAHLVCRRLFRITIHVALFSLSVIYGVLGKSQIYVANATTQMLSRTERLSEETEVTVNTFTAAGDYLLLWIAPDPGFLEAHMEMAQRLAKKNIEVWQVDLLEALFLPRGSSSMRRLTGRYVADLLRLAHRQTGKKIVLVGDLYGAIPVLRGARAWQLSTPPDPYLAGAILISPSLYRSIPPLGKDPEYLPIVDATNIPILIFQSGNNGNRWQIQNLVTALQKSGSNIYVEIMTDVTGIFFDPERSAANRAYFERLPQKFKNAITLLAGSGTPLTARQIRPDPDTVDTGIDSFLKPYTGKIAASPIEFKDVKGKSYAISQFNSKLSLINFWATWCPPCVKEIPSLNRLRALMPQENFQLISINYAEGAEVVAEFMEKVAVDFPVLIDEDGSLSAKWKVLAFPSTFVIGPDGNIRYGVNAAIEWDDPDVVQKLRTLLPLKSAK